MSVSDKTYRRTAAFAAGQRRRERVILFVVLPITAVFVATVQQMAHPDWRAMAVVLPASLVVGELAGLFALWLVRRSHGAGTDLELVLGDSAMTLRRPGFTSTVRFADISAVKGKTGPAGELEIVEVFRSGKVLRLHDFESMREVFDTLAQAAGGRALVVARGAERHFSKGPWGMIAGSLLAAAVIAWRWLGPGWTFRAEIVYQLVPAAMGLWFLVGRPLSQNGATGKKTLETSLGIAALLASAGMVWVTMAQAPQSPAVVVEGRTVRSAPLGIEFELPPSWSVLPSPPGTQVMLHDSQSDAVLEIMGIAVSERAFQADAFLRQAVAGQPMHLVSDIHDGRIGELAARMGRVEANDAGRRAARVAVAQRGAFALATTCAVAPKAEPDFSPCDEVLREALRAR